MTVRVGGATVVLNVVASLNTREYWSLPALTGRAREELAYPSSQILVLSKQKTTTADVCCKAANGTQKRLQHVVSGIPVLNRLHAAKEANIERERRNRRQSVLASTMTLLPKYQSWGFFPVGYCENQRRRRKEAFDEKLAAKRFEGRFTTGAEIKDD
ncbi:hypothetical protein J6590_032567 [Homalodisca vitripennis]|nr:hypothetical protein J6590_032567 [Homalodisca vitripennis]